MLARDDLHTLLDAIPEDRLPAIREALERLADPVLLAFLSAPEDDEPLTDEDVAMIEEGKADIARGDMAPLDEVERRLLGRG
jgi:hypothetical protein